jgi:hypothetical protein
MNSMAIASAAGILMALSCFIQGSPGEIYAKAYPKAVADIRGNFIVLQDGQKIAFDDGRDKTFTQKLASADLEDQLSQPYPTGEASFTDPAQNYDPGRFRCQEFFLAVYGRTEQEVRKNLVRITWLPKSSGKKVWVTKVNGVDKQLEKVSAEIDQLPPRFKEFVTTIGGTFNWRKIAGTKRLSAHSFGISIDLNPKKSSYWRWDAKYKYKNKLPREIVEIFEKHGFIWGGKWYHYDTMHFEYRPELLICRDTTP